MLIFKTQFPDQKAETRFMERQINKYVYKTNFHVRLEVLCSVARCESNGDLPVTFQHGTNYQVDAINDITFNMMVLTLLLITVPNMY